MSTAAGFAGFAGFDPGSISQGGTPLVQISDTPQGATAADKPRKPANPATPSLTVAVDPAGAARWLVDLLAVIGSQQVSKKWQCPVHATTGDHSTSLALGVRILGDGAWLHCHAGCDFRDILRALHLSGRELIAPPAVTAADHARAWRLQFNFPAPKAACKGSLADQGYRFNAEHPYGWPETVAWKMRYRHRSGAKQIRWESLNPSGERVPGLLGRTQHDLPLYEMGEVRRAVAAGETVFLVESESSVDALMKVGFYATCWPGGAGDPPLEQLAAELGGHGDGVVLVPDVDDAGLSCARRIRAALPGCRVLLGDPGEDARDVLARVGAAGLVEAVGERRWWARVAWPA